MISALISATALGQSLLAAHLFVRRVSHSNVYLPLAMFFTANAVVQLCFIIRGSMFLGADPVSLSLVTLFKLLVELLLPPLFWIYVRELTSEHSRGLRRSDTWHFVLPLLPGMLLALVLMILCSSRGPLGFVNHLNGVLNVAALLQFCVYIALVMVRLRRYRRKLMDLFASTTEFELRWFRWAFCLLLLGVAMELSAEVLYAMYQIPNPYKPWNDLLRVVLVWFFAVWGLRQRPDLRIEIVKSNSTYAASTKYEKSALTHEQRMDVVRKIRQAVEEDKGYRNPSLSLRTLADQIQVLPNYVSQALNMEIKETFFDYVNRLRVTEAMKLLEDTQKTVLAISAEVGFNSRSSFYAAFKKQTGKTPTYFKNQHLGAK